MGSLLKILKALSAKISQSWVDGSSNDLTQLTLGVDRDSGELVSLASEQNDAVKLMIECAISEAHRAGRKIGLCRQAPSDPPEFDDALLEKNISSILVSPDSFAAVKQQVAASEAARRKGFGNALSKVNA